MLDTRERYETKTVKALRGTERRSIAKWHREDWELVDQSPGTLHTTLSFRRPKPPLPVRQIVLGGVAALVLAGIITVGALLEGDGDAEAARSTVSAPVATEQSVAPETSVAAEQPSSAPTSTATQQPSRPPAPITDTTVDQLFDRLNAGSRSGIEVGDRFRLTGELYSSVSWGTGASGDFAVYLKAKGGANDLMVFVDESDAAGWVDGTRVQMVVESVEVTINGETTDGWLRARSVTTLS